VEENGRNSSSDRTSSLKDTVVERTTLSAVAHVAASSHADLIFFPNANLIIFLSPFCFRIKELHPLSWYDLWGLKNDLSRGWSVSTAFVQARMVSSWGVNGLSWKWVVVCLLYQVSRNKRKYSAISCMFKLLQWASERPTLLSVIIGLCVRNFWATRILRFLITEKLCFIAAFQIHMQTVSKLSWLVAFLDPSRIRFALLCSLMAYSDHIAAIFEGKNVASFPWLFSPRKVFIGISIWYPSMKTASSLHSWASKTSERICCRKCGVIYLRLVESIRPRRRYLLFVSWQWCEGDINGVYLWNVKSTVSC